MSTARQGRPARHRTALTSTGWTYLAIVPILAGATYWDARIVVLVALWAALGMAHLVLARLNLWDLRLEIEALEPRTREGRAMPLELRLSRRFNPVTARNLTVRLNYTGAYLGQSVPVPGPIRRGTLQNARTLILPRKFGRCFVNAASVTSTYPFGLYEIEAEWLPPPTTQFMVWPRTGRIPAGGGLHEQASRAGGGAAQPGTEVRPYQAGDPLALICWKSTARTGRMQVRPRETFALRPRVLFVSTNARPWFDSRQFWTMVALASALLEEGWRRRTISGLHLDGTRFPLAHDGDFVAAMDALCTVRLRRNHKSPEIFVERRPRIVLLPYGRHGVRALSEKGAVLSHVA